MRTLALWLFLTALAHAADCNVRATIITVKVAQNMQQAVEEWQNAHPEMCISRIDYNTVGSAMLGYTENATISYWTCRENR